MSHLSNRDRLVGLTATALRQARRARDQLAEVIVPMLPPQRRSFAQQVMQRIGGGDLFAEACVRDLAALHAAIGQEIARGTQVGWVADDHDVTGGREVRQVDDRASALAGAADDLRDLLDAINGVLDHVRAAQIVDELFGA